MGSITSSHQQQTSPATVFTTNTNFKGRKSKRLMDKLRRKSSADNHSSVIDPVLFEFAQNTNEDPQLPPDCKQTLDLDEVFIQLRDGRQSTPTNPETGFIDGATHSQAESTKQNADRTVSFNSTATAKTSPREVLPQTRNSITYQLHLSVPEDNQICSADNNPRAIFEGAEKPPEAKGI